MTFIKKLFKQPKKVNDFALELKKRLGFEERPQQRLEILKQIKILEHE